MVMLNVFLPGESENGEKAGPATRTSIDRVLPKCPSAKASVAVLAVFLTLEPRPRKKQKHGCFICTRLAGQEYRVIPIKTIQTFSNSKKLSVTPRYKIYI